MAESTNLGVESSAVQKPASVRVDLMALEHPERRKPKYNTVFGRIESRR